MLPGRLSRQTRNASAIFHFHAPAGRQAVDRTGHEAGVQRVTSGKSSPGSGTDGHPIGASGRQRVTKLAFPAWLLFRNGEALHAENMTPPAKPTATPPDGSPTRPPTDRPAPTMATGTPEPLAGPSRPSEGVYGSSAPPETPPGPAPAEVSHGSAPPAVPSSAALDESAPSLLDTQPSGTHPGPVPGTSRPGPAEALADLLNGNRRFVRRRPRHGHDIAAAAAASGGQEPYAVVVGCIDSRVPLEAIFDQTFGSICVVRSGGQVLDRALIGSVEFAVSALGVPLVMVLGHERCGAVGATVDALKADEHPDGALGYLVSEIAPAVRDVGVDDPQVNALAMRRHVERTVARLADNEVISAGSAVGSVAVVGAVYDLDTGQVELLPSSALPRTQATTSVPATSVPATSVSSASVPAAS